MLDADCALHELRGLGLVQAAFLLSYYNIFESSTVDN